MKIYRKTQELLDIGISDKAAESYDLDTHERSVSLSFELDEYLSLKKGDKITYNGIKYYLSKDYIPAINKDTDGYKYDLSFYSIETRFYDFLVKYQGKTDFNLNTTASNHLKLIADTIRECGLGEFTYETSITDFKDIQYENLSIHDALNLIGNTYECEWWLDDKLNLGEYEYGIPVVMEYDKELDSIDFGKSIANLITRLIAYGGTKNMIGGERLTLPADTPYIDMFPDLQFEQIIEGTQKFDEIFPKQSNSITEIKTYVVAGGEDTQDTTIYQFRDENGIVLTENDLLPDKLKVTFTSGSLNNKDFDLIIKKIDNVTFYEIIKQEEGENYFPNPTVKPVIGDTYILHGFKAESVMPSLVTEAKNELKQAAENFLVNIGSELVYDVKSRSIYCEEHEINLSVGQRVLLKSPNLGEIITKVRKYKKNLHNPFEFTVQYGNSREYIMSDRLSVIAEKVINEGRGLDASILSELSKLNSKFLSKVDEDSAQKLITFLKGIIVNGLSKFDTVELENLIANELARLKKGAIFGEDFITGMIGGKGAKIAEDENGKSILEIDKITAREELVVPKITFNNIDVISGDQASTFAFGTIKNVDTENRTFELELLEGEIGTLKQNDICRGVFHNTSGGNVESDFTDTNGFLNYSGFATSYFSPSQILINEAGQMKVGYFIQPGTTVHPISGMNFFAYGNFTDPDRQYMTYQNRLYTRRLKNMDTWDIVPSRNIAFQDGLLDGLTIGGMVMHGHGTYSENNYMTGVNIQFTPQQLDELRGKASYSVSLSSYERVVKLDDEGIHALHEELNVVTGDLNVTTEGMNVITSVNNLSTRIQAFKGEDELLFAETPEKGKYVVVKSEHGCVASVQGGILSIDEITNLDECYVDVSVNCEGMAVFEKRFSVVIVRDGQDGKEIMMYLTDQHYNFPGSTTSALPGSTTTDIMVYKNGNRVIPTAITVNPANLPAGMTATVSPETGRVTFTVTTSMTSPSGSVPVSFIVEGQTFSLGFGYGISFRGADGITKDIRLDATAQIIRKLKNGTWNPSEPVIVRGSAINTEITQWAYSVNGGDFSATLPNGVSRSGNLVFINPAATIAYALYSIRAGDGTILDTISVVRIEDGKDGESAPLLYLSVSSDVMTFDADNNPKPASQTITIEAKIQNIAGEAIFTALPYIGSTAQQSITLGGTGNTRTLKQNQWGANVDRVVITAVLGSLSDVKTVVKVKDGTNGEDGETPVVNVLIPSVTQIGKTMTGSYEPSSFMVYHRRSTGEAVNAYMAVWGSNNGSTWTQAGSTENVSQKTVDVASYPFKYYTIRTYSTSSPAWATAYLLSVSVNTVADGQDGGIGPRGAMPVYCGYFKTGTTYTYSNETRDIILRDFSGQTFAFQVKVHGSNVAAPPSSSTGDANWEVANKYSFVAMDTALIDGANIAGFMFKNSKMVSRMGTLDGVEIDIKNVPSGRINDFIPYTSMDGNSGEIKGERVIANNIQNKIKTAYSNSPAEIAAILSNGHSINMSPPEGTSFPADYNWYTISLPDNKDLSGTILTIHAPMASIKRYRIKPGNANAVFYVNEPAKVVSELNIVNGVHDTIELKAVWDEFNNTLDWHVLSRVNYKIQNNQGDGSSIRVPSVFKPGDIIAMGDVSTGGAMSNLLNRYDENITCSVSSGRFSLLVPNSRYYLPGSSTLSDRYSNLDKLDLQVTPNTTTFMNSYVYKYYSSSYGIYFNIEFRTYNGSAATAIAFKFILRTTDYVVNSKYLDYSV